MGQSDLELEDGIVWVVITILHNIQETGLRLCDFMVYTEQTMAIVFIFMREVDINIQ